MKRKRNLEQDKENVQDDSEAPHKHARHHGYDLQNIMLDESDWDDSIRPKWSRKDGHPNIKYRCKGKPVNNRGRFTDGVSSLFESLETVIPSRSKKQSRQAKAPLSDLAATQHSNQATSSAGQAADTTTESVPRENQNPRKPVSIDSIRSTAPEGWDPYENEFYSGDDNISDDGLEYEGKASAYRPPRMACRRCNKFKQPCDHAYPSCGLCSKYNQRCRYRDDLTGRQIRPGQLEEVEAAYFHSLQEVRGLKEVIETQKRSLEVASQKVLEWETTVRNIMNLRNVTGDGSGPQNP